MEGVLQIRRPWIFLGLLAACELAAIIFGKASFSISQAGEDGSFYIAIAHNMATGHGVTFDGLAPTTGVHWGWLLLLSSVFKVIATNDPETLFRIAGVVYFLCLLGAGLIVAQRHPIAAVLMVAYLANRGHWDMETHLVLFTLAALYAYPVAVCGLLVVLTRTDMVIFAGILGLLTGRWPIITGAGIGFVAVGLLNLWVDGNAVSVSAQIKSAGWNDLATIYRTVGHLVVYYFPVLEIICALALVYLWVERCRGILPAGFIASLALLLIHIARNSMTEGWYLAPLFLSALLCTSALVRQAMAYTATPGPMKALSRT